MKQVTPMIVETANGPRRAMPFVPPTGETTLINLHPGDPKGEWEYFICYEEGTADKEKVVVAQGYYEGNWCEISLYVGAASYVEAADKWNAIFP